MRQEIFEITPVLISDTQPIAIRGLESLIAAHPMLDAAGCSSTLEAQAEFARNARGGILILDRAFGQHAILEFLAMLRSSASSILPIIWGSAMNDAEALRYLQCGARGILQKTAPLPVILNCLESVAQGKCWMHEPDSAVRGSMARDTRSALTPREQEVMALVEQGFKNREIAIELGIRPGTVKIHLKHIFEKTGVHGRYGLALNGLKDRKAITATG
ncbi:MAG TPA: response regulator transcription factor [Bryobacteraceae bacterium]|jgi:two-component system nitrate/nitrite response regulator NarL|nr:response regulator transcription factor [Bryobacteraceae bacterium]